MEDPLNTETLLLDAVNILLESINEQPIEDEEAYDFIVEARQARNKVLEVKRAVLSEGWDFNTDAEWVMSVNSNGEIPLSSNILDIASTDGDVIARGNRLYSKSNQSFVFDEEVTCKVIWDLDFNTLTHPIRHYITVRACRVFQGRTIQDINALKINEYDEEDARLAARRSETRTKKPNMLTSQYGLTNRIRS